MELTLFLPYFGYNDESFDVNENYYKENDYIKAMQEEYNKNKDIVFNSILGLEDGRKNALIGVDGQTYKFGQKDSQNEEKVAYTQCKCTVYNDDGINENVNGLITHYVSQEPFIIMVEIDIDSCDEEFESELSLWVKEHKGIDELKGKMGDDWAWKNEPVRELKYEFLNKANKKICGMFENCKIMDLISKTSFILFIEKMTIVN